MKILAERRPVFHSEADFQFAFSQIMANEGVDRIRLERRVKLEGRRVMQLDITGYLEGNPIVLELKYPKDGYVGTVPTEGFDEDFTLSVGEPGLVYIWKDVERIEALVDSGLFTDGAAITLTNFKLWREKLRQNQLQDFMLNEGRTVNAGSTLEIPVGTTWAVEGIRISLASSYTCAWHPYSAPHGTEFQYLVFDPKG